LVAGCVRRSSRFALLGAWGGFDARRNEEAEVLRERIPQGVVCGLAEYSIQSEVWVVKSFHWSVVLSLEDACGRCGSVNRAWEDASDSAEYGVGWYEFINTDDRVSEYLDKWWEAVPSADKQAMLADEIDRLSQKLAVLKEFLE